MHRTNIYLTDEQVAQLDRRARAETRLLSTFQPVPVDPAVAWRAGELRRTYRRSHAAIGTAEYLIAVSADVHGYQLATLNVRHFPMSEWLTRSFEP